MRRGLRSRPIRVPRLQLKPKHTVLVTTHLAATGDLKYGPDALGCALSQIALWRDVLEERSPLLTSAQEAALNEVPFPEAFVINLDHRVDRWAAIEQTCRTSGIYPRRMPAVRTSPGWRGCALSHVQCIRVAKEKALPWVLILEDDATFAPEAIERFRELLVYLWKHRTQWERFNGGPTLPPEPKIRLLSQDPRLAYVNGFCAHFNLIHRDAYDMILQYDVDRDRMIDVFYMNLETRFRTVFNTVATYPHISMQTKDRSDIQIGNRDYAPYFIYSEKKLRECFNTPSQQSK